ncbi:MAG TPA: TadE/TadG family type IV pilus assembly protein [Terriglobales bacterium]|nr:TadE/TadG family type IV pilus assembly protein [Terriglobales bacterium]
MRFRRQTRGRRQRHCHGSALVEFALTIGVTVTLLLAVVQCSLALYAYHFVAGAAQMASRYALVRGATCSGWTSACPASADDLTTYVQGLAPPGIAGAGLTVTTTWSPDNSPGSTVNVKVRYSYTLSIPFISPITLPMSSQSQMVISQ